MSQALTDFRDVCNQVSNLLDYKPVDWSDEFVNHLKNLQDLAKLFSDKLSLASRINIDVDDYVITHLIPLGKEKKKIKKKYKIFRCLGKLKKY